MTGARWQPMGRDLTQQRRVAQPADRALVAMRGHVSALEELLGRCEPGHYGRDTIAARLAEARAHLAAM